MYTLWKVYYSLSTGAKKIDNDVSIIKEYIEDPNIKVAISVAPSFVSVFKESRKILYGL